MIKREIIKPPIIKERGGSGVKVEYGKYGDYILATGISCQYAGIVINKEIAILITEVLAEYIEGEK